MADPETPPSHSEPERAMSSDVIATLVAGHREFLRFLERKVKSREVAEDILQEAFVRSIRRADTLRNDESVTAWFYRMLRNAVVDHFRRRGASERATAAMAAEIDEATEPDVETKGAVCQCVRALAGTLKPEYADAITRVEVDGVSVQDFAQETSITPNNAAVRLFRAREALRKRVKAACGTCAEHGCLDCTCEPSRAMKATSKGSDEAPAPPAEGERRPR